MTRLNERLARISGIGFALVMTLALIAGPLLAECQNLDGTDRECTPSENWRTCRSNARDAYHQCYWGTTGWGRFGCAIAYDFDAGSCHTAYINEVFF